VTRADPDRRRLFGLAYRMLGSAAEAEDCVQEALLRWHQADRGRIDSPTAWLDSVVARLCLDHLKSARVRREQYVGPWLPEPVRTEHPGDAASLSFAALLLLQTLGPAERAAHLLHEVFGYSHAEVSRMLGTGEDACRQMAHRARARIAEGRPRFEVTREQRERLLAAFLEACAAGDPAALLRILAEDAVALTDSGGKALAARRVLRGASNVARFLTGVLRKAPARLSIEPSELNGGPALILRYGEAIYGALLLDGEEEIRAVHLVVNPDKLAAIDRIVL
jgi:RNA polymerase sigma-70 factor, ECF subfamily